MLFKMTATLIRRPWILAGLVTMSAVSCAWCAGPSAVVISEIAWMGTAASTADEWIELRNLSEETIDLAGWRLEAEDGTPSIDLEGKIASNSFYLLERTDDETISDLTADLLYTGLLENGGETLRLIDAAGRIVDEVSSVTGWFAGTGSPDYATMERINPELDGLRSNWETHTGEPCVGLDAGGHPIHGTPGAVNSVTRPPSASFAFDPEAPTVWDVIQFTDWSVDPDGTVASRFWTFGDLATSGEMNPAHRYAAPGTYIIRLVVADEHGLEGETSRSLVVACVPGDLNGDGTIDLLDVRLCYRIAAGILDVTAEEREAADVTGDGKVDMADVERLANHALGI